jgi:hypothetical protein
LLLARRIEDCRRVLLQHLNYYETRLTDLLGTSRSSGAVAPK